jgi:dephospho-CoA kinase
MGNGEWGMGNGEWGIGDRELADIRGMLTIGLTGNIGSGKSSVARVWKALGATVVEADELARRAVAPGTPGLARVVERWGEDVLRPDGSLDRAALRDVVFRDEGERRRLERIVHPEVNRLRGEAFGEAERRGESLVVADIPLLFEVGGEGDFDVVVLVDAPKEVRLERLVRDRGLDADEARRMIDAQMPAERKRGEADIVIENAGSLAELDERARIVWEKLLARARAGAKP